MDQIEVNIIRLQSSPDAFLAFFLILHHQYAVSQKRHFYPISQCYTLHFVVPSTCF